MKPRVRLTGGIHGQQLLPRLQSAVPALLRTDIYSELTLGVVAKDGLLLGGHLPPAHTFLDFYPLCGPRPPSTPSKSHKAPSSCQLSLLQRYPSLHLHRQFLRSQVNAFLYSAVSVFGPMGCYARLYNLS